jgi:hypothetical protein
MFVKRESVCRPAAIGLAVLIVAAQPASLLAQADDHRDTLTADPVVARLHEHLSDSPRPVVLAVDARQFPPAVWKRVEHLVAFRLHRHQPDGTTLADAATYLVRGSALYFKAAAALRREHY